MSIARYESILAALEAAQVRYVIAGGFAVNLHGFLRLTKDLDLLIDLEPGNALRAVQVLGACGLKPRVPVALEDFADPAKRRDWFENRNMLVFQVWHPDDLARTGSGSLPPHQFMPMLGVHNSFKPEPLRGTA